MKSFFQTKEKNLKITKEKNLKILFLFLGGLFFLIIIISFDIFNYTRRYKSYQEAMINHYSCNGWIPDFVPEDAYEIKDWHEVSPQSQILSFKFMDSENFKRKVQEYKYRYFVGDAYLRPKKISKNQVNWLPTKGSHSEVMDIYQMPDHYQTACLIIEWSLKTAYFRSDCIKRNHSTQ